MVTFQNANPITAIYAFRPLTCWRRNLPALPPSGVEMVTEKDSRTIVAGRCRRLDTVSETVCVVQARCHLDSIVQHTTACRAAYT